jgi:hypothetical protein
VSAAEDALIWQLSAAAYPPPVVELVFAPPRRWRFDLAWPEQMIAVEVEGGSYVGGRHSTGPGFWRDCEKYNAAVVLGWRVLRFTPAMINDGRALTSIGDLFDAVQIASGQPRGERL